MPGWPTTSAPPRASQRYRAPRGSWRSCFFFSSRRRHTRSDRDWSSDVCSSDLKVTRERLQNSIQRIDTFGNISRLFRTTMRRVYKVAGPNALWHIDGHHKLIRWKFVIHAGIDGFSRIITYIHCSGNNKARTVFKYFREGTHEFGIPSRVRAGGENARVEQFMNNYRGFDHGSFIKGKSVHNH